MTFSKAQNIRFVAQRSSKTIFYEASYDQILIEIILNALPHFPRKWFQLPHSKIWKNSEKWPFQTLRTFVFWVQDQFKNIFLEAYYDQISI